MSLPGLLAGGWLQALFGEIALWGGVLLLVAATLSFYHGWKRHQFASLLAETPRTDAGAVDASGVVRVRGTVALAPGGEPFTPPFEGGRECVLTAWEIEEMYDTPKTRSWEPAAWGVRSVPFYVEDATGHVRVEVPDRTVGNETDAVFTPERLVASGGVALGGLRCEVGSFDVQVETDYGETPPRRVREFLESTVGVSLEPMATDLVVDASRRRYREGTLRPGDEVSVVGYASRDDPKTPTDDGAFVVTESDETTLYVGSDPFDDRPDGLGSVLFGALTGLVGLGLLAAAFVL